jgi:hypothetical protein
VRGAAPHGPVHTADTIASLENANVISKLAEFVAGNQARHSRAEDDHFRSVRPAGENRARPGLRRHQIPRSHRAHHERRSADQAELLQEGAPGQHVDSG